MNTDKSNVNSTSYFLRYFSIGTGILIAMNMVAYYLSKISVDTVSSDSIFDIEGDSVVADLQSTVLPSLICGMSVLMAAALQSKSRNPLIVGGLMQSLAHVDAVSPFINATQELIEKLQDDMLYVEDSQQITREEKDPTCELSGAQGFEVQMNSKIGYFNSNPVAHTLVNGSVLMVWTSQTEEARQSGGGPDVYYKIYEESEAFGTEIPVFSTANITTPNGNKIGQRLSRQPVAHQKNGDHLIAFQLQGMKPYQNLANEGIAYLPLNYAVIQIYHQATNEFYTGRICNDSFVSSVQVQPSVITVRANGLEFFIAMQSMYKNTTDFSYVEYLAYSFLNSTTVIMSVPIQVNTQNTYLNLAPSDQTAYSNGGAALGDGRFGVVWHAKDAQYDLWNAWLNEYELSTSSAGEIISAPLFGGANFMINTVPSSKPSMPYLVLLSNENRLGVWVHYDLNTSDYGVKMSIWTPERTFVKSEILVDQPNPHLITYVSASMVSESEFVVAWNGWHPTDKTVEVIQQKFDLNGVPSVDTGPYGELVNTDYTCNDQTTPSILPGTIDGYYSIFFASSKQGKNKTDLIVGQSYRCGKQVDFDDIEILKDCNPSPDSLSSGEIAGITIGAIVAACLLGLGMRHYDLHIKRATSSAWGTLFSGSAKMVNSTGSVLQVTKIITPPPATTAAADAEGGSESSEESSQEGSSGLPAATSISENSTTTTTSGNIVQADGTATPSIFEGRRKSSGDDDSATPLLQVHPRKSYGSTIN